MLEKYKQRQEYIIMVFTVLTVMVSIFFTGLAYIKNKNHMPVGIDSIAASQEVAQIEELQENGIVYYDADKAVPLADGNDGDMGLRAVALNAYTQTNEIRAQAGLSPLRWDSSLENCSSVRAVESSQVFSHTRPNGQSWWTVDSNNMGGENLAYGYDNADEVVAAWMNSPTHAKNILYGKFKRIAITLYRTADGITYWAQEFGY